MEMTIVAKIEIMEEKMAMAKMMGHQDISNYYREEVRQLKKLQEEEKVRA